MHFRNIFDLKTLKKSVKTRVVILNEKFRKILFFSYKHAKTN